MNNSTTVSNSNKIKFSDFMISDNEDNGVFFVDDNMLKFNKKRSLKDLGIIEETHGKTINIENFIVKTDNKKIMEKFINNLDDSKTINCQKMFFESCDSGKKRQVLFAIFKGSRWNKKDQVGWSGLHFASKSGKVSTVKLLLKNNSYPSSKNIFLLTPLNYALSYHHIEIVNWLLKYDSKLNISRYENIVNQDSFTIENQNLILNKYKNLHGID